MLTPPPDIKVILCQEKIFREPKFFKCFGGKREDGESPETTLVRELKEETGITVPKLDSEKDKYTDVYAETHIVRFYLIKNIRPDEIKIGHEISLFKVFSREELEKEISFKGILPRHIKALGKIIKFLPY